MDGPAVFVNTGLFAHMGFCGGKGKPAGAVLTYGRLFFVNIKAAPAIPFAEPAFKSIISMDNVQVFVQGGYKYRGSVKKIFFDPVFQIFPGLIHKGLDLLFFRMLGLFCFSS